jgi:hypothetical protein
VVAGSDITGGATDNSSQGLAEREAATGHFIRHMKIHGESFFHPGSAEKLWSSQWAGWYANEKAKGEQAAHAHAHVDIGAITETSSVGTSSPNIPSRAMRDMHIHTNLHMDGRKVAKSGAIGRVVP